MAADHWMAQYRIGGDKIPRRHEADNTEETVTTMPNRRRTKKASQTAAYYEQRRGNVSQWSSRPVKATAPPEPSAVFSLRLTPTELEEIREAAASRGTTISDFVRSAALGASQGLGSSGAFSTQCSTAVSNRVIVTETPLFGSFFPGFSRTGST